MEENFKTFIYIESLKNSVMNHKNSQGVYYGFLYNNFEDLPYELKNPKIISELHIKDICAFFMNNYQNSFAFTKKYMYLDLSLVHKAFSDFSNSSNEYFNFKSKIAYQDILKVEIVSGELKITVKDGKKYFITSPWNIMGLREVLLTILEKIFKEYNNLQINESKGLNGAEIAGGVFSNVSNAATNYGMDKIVNNPQGHGFAAERANHLSDILSGKNAELVGDNNVKSGPDRIVNGEYIQTKYCANPQRCVNECFDNAGEFKYSYRDANGNYKNMTIEVPSDMYDEAVKAMAKKIQEGKVPGVTDPNEAKNIVKKGSVTYQQAKNIARFGTVDGIIFDAKNGAIIATQAMGISAAITFATSIWNGEDFDVALKNATYAGIKVGGLSFVSAILASQLSRTALNSMLVGTTDVIIKGMGPRASAFLVNAFRSGKNIYGAAAMKSASKLLRGNLITGGITIAILSTFDVADMFKGRISGAQLFKNITSTAAGVAGGTAGWVGGAAAGAAAGSFVPFIGTAIGGIVGGIAGAFVGGSAAQSATKAALDSFIEEDADEMVRVLENVFAEVANEYLINKKEADEAVSKLQNKVDGSLLKDMYASSSRKSFARNLIEPIIESIAKERKKVFLPTEKQMYDELNVILEEMATEEEKNGEGSTLYATSGSRW